MYNQHTIINLKMAKVSKSETTTAPAAVAVAVAKPAVAKAAKVVAAKGAAVPAETPKKVVASEPAAAEPPKKKSKTAPTPVVAVAPVVVAAPVATEEAGAAVEVASAINTDFSDFLVKLQAVSSLLSSLKTDFRSLEKKSTRELKTASKAGAKRKRKTGNRSPSGFVKPTLISADLATFLGKPAGSEMARTEVTREINKYIRENNLQDTANGRKINADAKLAALLKIDTAVEELTYFNLQRYMSPHFAKKEAVATA